MKRLLKFIFMVLILTLVARCGVEEIDSPALKADGDGTVTMTFKIGSLDAALEKKEISNIKSFRIRVYSNTPAVEDEAALFDSLKIHGCFKRGGTEIRIQDLKAGQNRFVYFQGYSDEECSESDLYAVGIRGGISIEDESTLTAKAAATVCTGNDTCKNEVHPDAFCDCDMEDDDGYCLNGAQGVCSVSPPVFVPLYIVGKFNKLPVPSGSLKSQAAQVSCDSDEECQDKVHQASTCSEELGFCTMEGLFPFSPSHPRAFHTATALSTGKILFTGGFTRVRDGEVFYAGAPFFEVFNPHMGLFERPELQLNWGGQNVALHQATLAGSDRLLIAGGVSEMTLKYQQGDELKLRWELPATYENGCSDGTCDNFSITLITADAGTGVPFDTDEGLQDRLIGHQASLVRNGDVNYLLLSGGLSFSDSGQLNPSNQHVLCNAADLLDNQAQPACMVSDNGDTFPMRYSHADACLLGGGGFGEPCDVYMVFGGVGEGEPAGEVFSSGETPYNQLMSFAEITSLNKALFPKLVRATVTSDAPDKLYSFGGVSSVSKKPKGDEGWFLDFPAPDVQPQQVNVNLNNFSMTTGQMDLMDLQPPGEVYRLFQTVSVLQEKDKPPRVMLAGGIGENTLPTKSVLFFEEPKTHALTYIAKTKMKEARFGHTATVLDKGLLKGAVLVVGGFTVTDVATGAIEFAEGAEIYIP